MNKSNSHFINFLRQYGPKPFKFDFVLQNHFFRHFYLFGSDFSPLKFLSPFSFHFKFLDKKILIPIEQGVLSQKSFLFFCSKQQKLLVLSKDYFNTKLKTVKCNLKSISNLFQLNELIFEDEFNRTHQLLEVENNIALMYFGIYLSFTNST